MEPLAPEMPTMIFKFDLQSEILFRIQNKTQLSPLLIETPGGYNSDAATARP